MMLTEVTSISADDLPLSAFKDHLRLGTGFSDADVQDGVVASFLKAAIANIEARTGKVLLRRDFIWKLSAWRDARGQILPVSPVTDVSELAMQDRGGDVSIVDADKYRLEGGNQTSRLLPNGFILPIIPLGGTVSIRLTAGFADVWADLPSDLAQAVMLLAAHYYEFRHETSLGQGCMPFGVTSLIEPYRVVRLLGGRAS